MTNKTGILEFYKDNDDNAMCYSSGTNDLLQLNNNELLTLERHLIENLARIRCIIDNDVIEIIQSDNS